MKILSAGQIRELDKYTITNEPISSIDLMERAAAKLTDCLTADYLRKNNLVYIFCGMGNNGGDGLAIARQLIEQGFLHVNTFVVRHSPKASPDFEINEQRLVNFAGVRYIESEQQIPQIPPNAVVIDAIFGSGLTRPVEGISAATIHAINQSGAYIYSVDVPSGMFCDQPNSDNDTVIHSTCTFTFHAPKLSFMFSASGKFVPDFKVLDIGLSARFAESLPGKYYYITAGDVEDLLKKRDKFSHKGTYGHALICAGSYGKMGAAVLCVKATLRSGTGLVSTLVPPCGYEIMQVANPEAMVPSLPPDNETEKNVLSAQLLQHTVLDNFSAVGIGPGIGTDEKTILFFEHLLKLYKQPMVIDADALNILATHKNLLQLITPYSILTPHPGEFKRLTGDWKDDLEKLNKQQAFAEKHKVVLILKGANTSIAMPNGTVYFNSTGNPGMAKGGSGDVLTGTLTSVLAQHFTPEHAAVTGVYIHGLAGDLAAEKLGQTGMDAGDIVQYLPAAFKKVN